MQNRIQELHKQGRLWVLLQDPQLDDPEDERIYDWRAGDLLEYVCMVSYGGVEVRDFVNLRVNQRSTLTDNWMRMPLVRQIGA